jgi:hypothetical protein
MTQILKDRDLILDVDNYDVILVGTTIYSMLTNGFQSKIASKFPIVDEINAKTPYGNTNKYGKRITVDTITPIISLMYIAGYPHSKRAFLNEEALINCLSTANAEFKGEKVATTLVGTTRFDGNGDRDRILEIIEENTKDLDLYVYDYEQLDKRVEREIIRKKLREEDYELYQKYKKDMTEYYKKFYLA